MFKKHRDTKVKYAVCILMLYEIDGNDLDDDFKRPLNWKRKSQKKRNKAKLRKGMLKTKIDYWTIMVRALL